MKHSTVAAACLLLACQVSQSLSSPVDYNAPAGGQIVFSPVSGSSNKEAIHPSDDDQIVNEGQEHEFNVLHHLSGISPFFDSHGKRPDPPQGCAVTSVSILARHSSITMNDDEWPETIEPFLTKLKKYKKKASKKNKKNKKHDKHHNASEDQVQDDEGVLDFLLDWTTPVTEDTMEQLTGPGAEDARALGKRLAELYKDLIPGHKEPAVKIYSASSARDVDSSTAFISGLLPNRSIGTSKGQVDLVKVPNTNADWAFSLTPHKICDRFDKKQGKEERDAFQKLAAGPVIERLSNEGELEGWRWNWTDVIAMQQMCGYETVIRGSSPFCNVFNEQEWLDFEYGQDLYYYHMLGRHRKWTAALGVPWIEAAAVKLKEAPIKHAIMPPIVPSAAPARAASYLDILKKKKEESSSSTTSSSLELPKPSLAPNATLPQSFNIWFTHREEVPLVTHALDLFHGHDEATRAMPLDRVNPDRAWKTSEIIPFLGHVSLERMECTIDNDGNNEDGTDVQHPFVRIIVNGSPHQQPVCHDGPGGSCPLSKFLKIVEELPGIFGTVKEVCQQKDD